MRAQLCLLTDRWTTLFWNCFSHRYFKPCRLYAQQPPVAEAERRGSRTPQSGGGFSVLFAEKGDARLRQEKWESKAPSQGASLSRAIPPMLLRNSYAVQHSMHLRRERANRASIRVLRSLRDLPAHVGFLTLLDRPAITPHQSRGFALDQEGQRYFACLVDSLLFALARRLRARQSIAVIYLRSADCTIRLESLAGAPRSRLAFAEGLITLELAAGGWAGVNEPAECTGEEGKAGAPVGSRGEEGRELG